MTPSAPDLSLLAARVVERGFLGGEALASSGWTIDGRYRVLERLGAGANGTVFRVHDADVEREAALKLLSASPSDTGLERFRQEVRLLAQVRHEGIVPVYAAGVHDGRPYYVMECAPAGSLRDAELELRAWVRALLQACLACEAAHAQGVIHRDLKPENVLLVDGRAVLIDFGIAKLLDPPEPTQTQSGTLVGTPRYMAPEQLTSSSEVGPWSDTYALGVMLFERLTGEVPFPEASLVQLVVRLVAPERPDPQALAPDAPPGLCRIARKAIARDPRARYPTAEALALDLGAWLHAPAREVPSPRGVYVAAASGALALVLGAALWLGGGGEAATPDEGGAVPPAAVAPEPADREPDPPELPPGPAAEVEALLVEVRELPPDAAPSDLAALSKRARAEVMQTFTTETRLREAMVPELAPALEASLAAVAALPPGPDRDALEGALRMLGVSRIDATTRGLTELANSLEDAARAAPRHPEVATTQVLWGLLRARAAQTLPRRMRENRVPQYLQSAGEWLVRARGTSADVAELEALGRALAELRE